MRPITIRVDNAEIDQGIEALIRLPDGGYFREFVTMFLDQDHRIGRFVMPYREHVTGDVAVNYHATPLRPRNRRLGRGEGNPKRARLFDEGLFGPPNVGIFAAQAGEEVRFRVVSAYSEQVQVFSVEGHDWELTPGLPGADIMSARFLPSGGTLNLHLRRAGGPAGRAGDYLWSNHRMPFYGGRSVGDTPRIAGQ